jgi:hypothetical protein
MTAPVFHMITGAPDSVAPFSHAVEADGWVFAPETMPFVSTALDSTCPEGIEAQTGIAIDRIAWRGNASAPPTPDT